MIMNSTLLFFDSATVGSLDLWEYLRSVGHIGISDSGVFIWLDLCFGQMKRKDNIQSPTIGWHYTRNWLGFLCFLYLPRIIDLFIVRSSNWSEARPLLHKFHY